MEAAKSEIEKLIKTDSPRGSADPMAERNQEILKILKRRQ
jgi:hypothetical protein